MPNSVTDTVTINIMDREFKIKCPNDKVAELQEAATYLDDKMRDTYHGNKLIPIDRIAITAALNIVHELILEKQQPKSHICDLNERLLNLKNKLCQTLANGV
jgi:cell division protein ZapA